MFLFALSKEVFNGKVNISLTLEHSQLMDMYKPFAF